MLDKRWIVSIFCPAFLRRRVSYVPNEPDRGQYLPRLLVFAVPYLLANLIQALYGAVDMAVVGWFANAAGISAVSVGSQVMQIVTSLVSGLTMGGTILIANYFGAGHTERPFSV